MTPTSDLDELARLAKAATPDAIADVVRDSDGIVHFNGHRYRREEEQRYGAFRFAATPTRVLALVEELRARRAQAKLRLKQSEQEPDDLVEELRQARELLERADARLGDLHREDPASRVRSSIRAFLARGEEEKA